MPKMSRSRRSFLQTSAGLGVATSLAPALFVNTARSEDKPRSPNSRLGVGAIGLRYQGTVITEKAREYGDIVAVCDVDRHVREQARASFGSTPQIFEDYRDLLKRKDVDVVLIGTPDHWHAKMLIDACLAGKDVYCEKPLTLTIDEGKHITKAVQETGRVVQVGSWQRSDHRFRLAVELVRQGRLGELQQVEVVLGKDVVGGPFEKTPVPKNLNWNLWQGQTPDVPYIQERCHYTFRWWQEYSGGQMTDWGAHHVDIARWAINDDPVEIEGVATYPNVTDGYNVPIDFSARYKFGNGVELTVADHGRNGIMFTGTDGRVFVNRENIQGKPVEDLATRPLSREQFNVYDYDNHDRPERAGKLDAIINHMGNFFDCVQSRRQTISDVQGQHRSISVCHLGNISMKLGRQVKWDPVQEEFPGDAQANALLKREQRAGFEVG
ncbi:Gfo/Idh/MocA family oxidoreductase [Planctomicrobium piriforme]|uniref:Predicted dehydrogenase n=1 Tax=Planctomicrobium piriforme TaxID=1576369 RepID=A0A1I3PDS4_9PLAN|nr:Gfo/Idh/MocA family oxidoreductase [Planctomicrobium piriforme]SFJ19685.1 Predicted dehydrogenase [Planctomicrobium piriforme]